MHRAKTLTAMTIIVVGSRITRFHPGIYEGLIERIERHVVAAGNTEGPIAAAIRVFAILPGFGALEVGKTIGIAPALCTERFPLFIVAGMPAHIDHAIDRRCSTKPAAAWTGNLAIVDIGFRI